MKKPSKKSTTMFQAVKAAAFQNQPKQGLGTRFIPNKKKTTPRWQYRGQAEN